MSRARSTIARQQFIDKAKTTAKATWLWLFASGLAYAGPPDSPPPGDIVLQITDTVQKGDTYQTVAQRTGCAWVSIAKYNQWPLNIRLKHGLTIRVPKGCPPPRSRLETAVFEPCQWQRSQVNHTKLKSVLDRLGFEPPAQFRALIVQTTLGPKDGPIESQRIFDYDNRAYSLNWNPASTVKIFSAAAAAERLESLGFSSNSRVTFHYDKKTITRSVRGLFHDALHRSDNVAHNQLVEVAGFRLLNGPTGTLGRLGLKDTQIMRAYAISSWKKLGRRSSLRQAPRLTVADKQGHRAELPASSDDNAYPCRKAACTTPSDLAKMMCKTVLHEQLPARSRLRLSADPKRENSLLSLFRQCLFSQCGGRYRRRPSAITSLRNRYFHEDEDYYIYRKAGYSLGWRSENIVIEDLKLRQFWTITIAAHGGKNSRVARKILDPAVDYIARIISEGWL